MIILGKIYEKNFNQYGKWAWWMNIYDKSIRYLNNSINKISISKSKIIICYFYYNMMNTSKLVIWVYQI